MTHLIKKELPHKDVDHDQVCHGCRWSNHHEHVGIDMEGFDVVISPFHDNRATFISHLVTLIRSFPLEACIFPRSCQQNSLDHIPTRLLKKTLVTGLGGPFLRRSVGKIFDF